jgi:hypothetical protein
MSSRPTGRKPRTPLDLTGINSIRELLQPPFAPHQMPLDARPMIPRVGKGCLNQADSKHESGREIHTRCVGWRNRCVGLGRRKSVTGVWTFAPAGWMRLAKNHKTDLEIKLRGGFKKT